ncbi:MAG: hypothetical protein ACK55I_08005, partial [bacterium]
VCGSIRTDRKAFGTIIPVRQHPALAVPAIEPDGAQAGPVGMDVDESRAAMLSAQVDERGLGHVHDLRRLHALARLARRSQPGRLRAAIGERSREEGCLPCGVAYRPAEGEVVAIAGAQRVAVGEQRADAAQGH